MEETKTGEKGNTGVQFVGWTKTQFQMNIYVALILLDVNRQLFSTHLGTQLCHSLNYRCCFKKNKQTNPFLLLLLKQTDSSVKHPFSQMHFPPSANEQDLDLMRK